MDPSSPLDRETIFRIELPLEEDVVAELERFVYLGRLGIVEEALQILDEILWRHLQHFPVAAEAVAFLIEHKMWTELHRTVNEIHYRNIRFTSNDENEFVDTLTTFVKHRAYQFIDLTEPCLTLADINGEHLDDQYTSPAKASLHVHLAAILMLTCPDANPRAAYYSRIQLSYQLNISWRLSLHIRCLCVDCRSLPRIAGL